MGWFQNPPAIWSFAGMLGSGVVLLIGLVYLWYCYYPGGYKKSEVMDIGEYAMFVAQIKYEERKKKLEKTEEEEYVNQYDELYHEMDPGEEYEEGIRPDGSDWQSVGTSEQHDIEGGEYYDATTSSSPTDPSQAGYTHDGQSTISPTSMGAPSQVSPSEAASSQKSALKPALKSTRDESESTSGSGSASGSGYYQ